MSDPLRDALRAVERLREITKSLVQSQRESDVRQVAAGIQTEALIIESSLRNALGAALSDAVADRPGLARTDAPETSKAAARAVSVRSGSGRGVLLRALRDAATLTDFEMQRATDLKPSTQRPRRVELVDLGLVRPHNTLTRQHEGSAWTVWMLTPLGQSVAAELVRLGHNGVVRVDPNTCVEESTVEADESDPVLF
jgi:hypothetical protein